MRKMQEGGREGKGGGGVGEGSLECLSDANDATVDASTLGLTPDTGPCSSERRDRWNRSRLAGCSRLLR